MSKLMKPGKFRYIAIHDGECSTIGSIPPESPHWDQGETHLADAKKNIIVSLQYSIKALRECIARIRKLKAQEAQANDYGAHWLD